MSDFSLQLKHGDDRVLILTATYPEAISEQDIAAGDPFPLTNKELWVTAKRSERDSDEDAVFQKTTADGITIRANPNEHIAEVAIDAADTASLPYGTITLVCDAQVKTEDDKTWTMASGKIVVSPDVTRST